MKEVTYVGLKFITNDEHSSSIAFSNGTSKIPWDLYLMMMHTNYLCMKIAQAKNHVHRQAVDVFSAEIRVALSRYKLKATIYALLSSTLFSASSLNY